MPIQGAPQAPVYVTTTINRFWTLFGNSTFLKANVKHAVPGDYLDGQQTTEKTAPPGAGELPTLMIDVDSDRVLSVNVMPTFGNTRGTGCDRVIEQEVTYKFTLVYDSLDLNLPNQVLTELGTMMLDDPMLGLAYIKSSGKFSLRSNKQSNGPAKGTRRRVQEMLFPVTYSLHRKDLFPNG